MPPSLLRPGERAGHRDGPVRDLSAHCACVLSPRPDRGGSLSRRASGQPALLETVATVRPRGTQAPGVAQPHAPPSLEAERRAKDTVASVPGSRPRAARVVLCQAAAQRLSGDEDTESATGSRDLAEVPPIAWAIRTKPRAFIGGEGWDGGLFIIKGGRPVFIKLVVAKNKI